MKNTLNTNKTINLGIETLRMILCFLVIAFHFSGKENRKKYKILNTTYHVPTFMIISFYYSYGLFSPLKIDKIKTRFERILIPYVVFPILMLSLRNEIYYQLYKDLLLQYLTGYRIHLPLWYLLDLLILTIFYTIIFYIFKKNYVRILIKILIISYLIQYYEINYIIFSDLTIHLRTLARIIDMLPISITGLILSSFKLLLILKKNIIKNFFCFIIIFSFIYNYNFNIFGNFKGFLYSGIKNNLAAISLFSIFSLIPFEKIKNPKIQFLLRKISSYTGGIYYFHPIIHDLIERKIKKAKENRIYACFLNYIFGYFVCLLGSTIFKNNKLKYLFF